MNHRPSNFLIKSVASAAVLMLAAQGAQASVTVYTDFASFSAATSALATDTFGTFPTGNFGPGSTTRSAGAYGYTASTDIGNLWGSLNGLDNLMGVQDHLATLTFGSFTGGAQAIGGYFFATDYNEALMSGQSLTVNFLSSTGNSQQNLTNVTAGTFLGFTTDGSMTSLSVTGVTPPGALSAAFVYPVVNNLSFGTVAAVPEPETYALMLAGLGVVGWVGRRRRHSA